MTRPNRIVVDGCARAFAALEPKIRAEVAAAYAARLEQAGIWARLRLKRRMEREIKNRVAERAPPHALY